jgi:holo-[acyl-carrier protein] synthase
MISALGHDVTSVARIARVLARGPRFARRCFTAAERAYCDTRPDPAAAYARRWAAKEAAAKALGTGIARGVFLKDIEVTPDPATGRPTLRLHASAAAALSALAPGARVHVSLSDDAGIASAVVVIEG